MTTPRRTNTSSSRTPDVTDDPGNYFELTEYPTMEDYLLDPLEIKALVGLLANLRPFQNDVFEELLAIKWGDHSLIDDIVERGVTSLLGDKCIIDTQLPIPGCSLRTICNKIIAMALLSVRGPLERRKCAMAKLIDWRMILRSGTMMLLRRMDIPPLDEAKYLEKYWSTHPTGVTEESKRQYIRQQWELKIRYLIGRDRFMLRSVFPDEVPPTPAEMLARFTGYPDQWPIQPAKEIPYHHASDTISAHVLTQNMRKQLEPGHLFTNLMSDKRRIYVGPPATAVVNTLPEPEPEPERNPPVAAAASNDNASVRSGDSSFSFVEPVCNNSDDKNVFDYETRKPASLKREPTQENFPNLESNPIKMRNILFGTTWYRKDRGQCEVQFVDNKSKLSEIQKYRGDMYGQFSTSSPQYSKLTQPKKKISDFKGKPGICTCDAWPTSLYECWQRADYTNVAAATNDLTVSAAQTYVSFLGTY